MKVIRLIALMTPAESRGLAVVSVTSSHHVSQSQQWFVLPMHYPPIAICPSNPLPLAQIQYGPLLTHKPKVGEMKARNIWQHFSWLKAMWRNHNYICGGGEGGGWFLLSPFSVKSEHKPAPLKSAVYVFLLLVDNWVEDGKGPICCVFNGWILKL